MTMNERLIIGVLSLLEYPQDIEGLAWLKRVLNNHIFNLIPATSPGHRK